ncbi:hypothetical protein BGZ94_002238, partial [Podila epigama]
MHFNNYCNKVGEVSLRVYYIEDASYIYLLGRFDRVSGSQLIRRVDGPDVYGDP